MNRGDRREAIFKDGQGRSPSGAVGGGGTPTAELGRSGAAAQAQRGPGQGGVGESTARRNYDAAGVDCRAAGDGQAGLSGLAVAPAESGHPRPIEMTMSANNMTISLTDPFMCNQNYLNGWRKTKCWANRIGAGGAGIGFGVGTLRLGAFGGTVVGGLVGGIFWTGTAFIGGGVTSLDYIGCIAGCDSTEYL